MIIQHGATETRRQLIAGDLTGAILGAAVEVHSLLGPGLLESAYDECVCRELFLREIPFRRQIDLAIEYKGVRLDCGYRIDILVAEEVIVELKAVERILPVHEAQLMTYMRLAGKRVGLLINFHVPALNRGGIVRRVI